MTARPANGGKRPFRARALAWAGAGAACLALGVAFWFLCAEGPSEARSAFAGALRTFDAWCATCLLRGLGVDAVRDGTRVAVGGSAPFALDVAERCSGLRSLVALLALSAGYAAFALRAMRNRALLLVVAIPLAVVANAVRIAAIGLIAVAVSADFAVGIYHDWSGYATFACAVAAMAVAGERLAKRERRATGGVSE